jgi:hypothetical protein
MKTRKLLMLFILPVIFFAFAQTGFSQNKFEGKVTLNAYDNGTAHTLEYYVKGNKIRFDANEEGRQGQVIMDPDAKQFMIIMPQQKMYMQMQIPDTEMEADNSQESNDDTKFVKTGETKEILGYTAEKLTYKDGEDQGEAWVTKEIGGLQIFDNPMQKNKPQWQKDFEEEGFFPLLVFENGKKVFEGTDIEKKALDDSMFEAPAGYQKMEMPMQK